MADLSDAQRKRAEGRQRRRSQPEPDSPSNDGEAQDSGHGVRQAAKVAAAAAAAGAAAAAAKALTSHDDEAPVQEDEAAEQPEPDEPRSAQEPEETEPEEQEPEREPEPPEDEPPVSGAAQSDARRARDRAREQLEDLLGRPVESVSSLERTHDGWVLALDVVELKRVPESTDVLASYELELDDDLNLRRYQQVRRYHRGRADAGEGQ